MHTATRSAALLALLGAGCNGILGLDPLTLAEGSGGAASSSTATTTATTTVGSGGGGGSGSTVATTTAGTGGGGSDGIGGGVEPTHCAAPASGDSGQRLFNPGFEQGDDGWITHEIDIEVIEDDSCEGTHFARLTSTLQLADMRTPAGPADVGQCVQLYFSARTSDVGTFLEVFLVSEDPFQFQQLMGPQSTASAGRFELFDARCRLDLPQDASRLTLDFDIAPFGESSWVEVDAMYLGLSDCEEGEAPPCFIP